MKKLSILLLATTSILIFASTYAVGNTISFTAKNRLAKFVTFNFPYAWFYVKQSKTYKPCSTVSSVPTWINYGQSKTIRYKSSPGKDLVYVCLRYTFPLSPDHSTEFPIKVKFGDTVSIFQRLVKNSKNTLKLSVTFLHNGKPVL